MHTLSAWFTRNPVAANLLMLLILIAGVFTLQSIRIEGFPALPSSSVTITTLYPGAGAEQVDRGVSRKIEKALEGMPGVKKISSFSEEGVSFVWVQKVSGFDMDRFQNEIESRVNAVSNLPQLAERPVIEQDEFSIDALTVQVYGNTDNDTLQKVARTVKEALLAHPEITKMTPFGLLPHEIRIEVDDAKLRAHRITLQDVARAIERASLDYRTGSIDSSAGKVVIRADQKSFSYEEFASIPLLTSASGARLILKDVADVIDGFEEENRFVRFQRMPSVGMMIYTSKKGHLIEVSKAAHSVVQQLRLQLPKGVKVDIWGEYGTYMKDRLSLLAANAWQGLLIVFVLLALFLNLKVAFWVAMGIPISIAGTLVLMGDFFLGYSLNEITTIGMIIVLGILVDDAVVVGESVFEARGKIKGSIEGTVQGVQRVSTATVFGCFTTVAAFYPLLLIKNDIAKLFAGFATVVIVALIISLLESKLILPAHLAAVRMNSSLSSKGIPCFWEKVQSFLFRTLMAVNNGLYRPLLEKTLRHRYTALMVFLTIAVGGVAMIFNGWVRTVFFPEVPEQIIVVKLQMRNGSPLHLTEANIAVIEAAAEQINVEAMAKFQTDKPPIARIMTAMTGPFNAEIYAELQPEKDRRLEILTTLKRWRNRVGTLEGAEELSFRGASETGGGFVIELTAGNDAVLKDAVERFSSELKQIEGIHDIRDDLKQGSPQIRLRLKPEAQHLGLSAADLAGQIGDAFGGLEVQRVLRGGDEVKVSVKYKKQRRRYMRHILDTHIRTEQGQWLPLAMVASIETGYVPASVNRQNGRRVVQVKAQLDKDQISPGEAFERIQKKVSPKLKALYPELTIKGAGELQEIGAIKGGMKRALIMILILIYALLAVPLKSYWQPLVIMAVIPFGFIGAIIGHWINGTPLSILSFFGMLGVMGVVVNDSLVMLTRFNDLYNQGNSLHESLVMAGGSRFRPIFLTTVTTVCGLMPLLFETSEQAQYLIPAAISLAWGELFATPITLLIVPIITHILHDVLMLFRKKHELTVQRTDSIRV